MCVSEGFVEVFTTIPIWYIALFIFGIVGAILTRSLILCLGVIVLAIVAAIMTYDVTGIHDAVKYGLLIVWLAIAAAMVHQIIYRVRRL